MVLPPNWKTTTRTLHVGKIAGEKAESDTKFDNQRSMEQEISRKEVLGVKRPMISA